MTTTFKIPTEDDIRLAIERVKEQPDIFKLLSVELKNIKAVALVAIDRLPIMFAWAGPDIRNDYDIALDVLKRNLDMYDFVSKDLKKNINFHNTIKQLYPDFFIPVTNTRV